EEETIEHLVSCSRVWDEIRKIEEIAVRSVYSIFEKSLSDQNFVHEFLYEWWKGNVVEVQKRRMKLIRGLVIVEDYTKLKRLFPYKRTSKRFLASFWKQWMEKESEQNIGSGTINFEYERLQDLVPRSERTKTPTE
ncbi:2493_t:CDS:2, partial [Gigaspora margarita]